ncbi:MAG TPA: hypothetical protein VMW01_03350 [Williamwhitmania sp.]|nr:hypothetical protein [Williamwhitmania sp.]
MKNALLKVGFGLFLSATSFSLFAQQPHIANMRNNDQTGINVFETTKQDTAKFEGMKVRVGGNFSQSYQSLMHSNSATPNVVGGVDLNALTPLSDGFNTATANLNFDVQLADGVRLNLVSYLSSRHHNETWVKGGYLQFDKLPFLHSGFIDNIMKFTTIRAGHMEINYGDAHFRRSDNGNTIYNPFIESYIMDAFTTEIGGDIMVRNNGMFGVFGVTGGEIKGDVTRPVVTATDDKAKRSPSFIGKLGYDKQLTDQFRLRVSGSVYTTASSASNTLYSGDRAGSHYFLVMENNNVTTATRASGRLDPGFSDKVTSFMGNIFLKYNGLEFFGTYETATGRVRTETSQRTVSQYAGDVVYRFGSAENFYVGARYNKAFGKLAGITNSISIDRTALSAGWFLTKNIMMKGEYVVQNYNDFPTTDIRSNGQFHGVVFEAAVAF